MGLTLCNSYPASVWTAIMFYSPETCGGDGGDFEMMGWWRIEPGSCALLYANDLGDVNRYWYYFAHAADGAVWAGPFGANVPRTAFGGDNACWGSQHVTNEPDFERIGFREFDVGDSDDATVTLTS
jgi:uncharacterized membrane protein